MSDTAAFFDKKKKKKKKFKSFNANKIDASAVTSATHVDAPDISAENVTTSLGGLGLTGTSAGAETSGDDQWADSQGGWGSSNKEVPATSGADSKVAELMDMQALNAKRNEQDDVAERFRIEETKAKLARAKEGMAKEAERLATEKAVKEDKAAGRAGTVGPGGRMGGGGTGGKWVPAHMRGSAAGASGGSRFGMAGSSVRGAVSMDGSGFQQKVDMSNEELFPDLAAAEVILADKEKQEKDARDRMATGKAKAPTGWGNRAGISAEPAAAPAQRKPLNLVKPPAERKPLNLTSSNKTEEDSQAKKEEKREAPAAAAAVPEAATAVAPAPVAVAATPTAVTPAPAEPVKKVLKKKKKKDLSTFKPKS